ncbi:glycosyltransferase family 2 protein [Acetobacter oeni]|uniref:Glycosyl transferase n=1 Tax=Acetobacter oeni TaxID=304077 RepID=A0A511XNY5_9PROT|nr:glycosyltransferase [Acetobacter oeni]MBB3881629.1 glycosyltransferase involved in cell wall biosynthesis [Acetobacter oeni]NHO17561.1 glycosyltransferase [Acetobacter oeni]GBR00959.1 glycosyltransferase [Acetobacter oeni LMG 21952]GEN64616.1 glycosyl transferase [Acetobacter oeni]
MTVEISAILTTHNRAHLLPRVLEGLASQTLQPDRFEIIAVDDGSTDDTREILAAWSNRLPLRIFSQRAAGLAAAKNLGVFAARAPVVVFLDDDDVTMPEFLCMHLAAHLSDPRVETAVLSRTVLAPEIESLPLMRHVTQVGMQLFSYGWIQPRQVLSFREFWGGRSSCKRSLLVRHGVFRPEFRFGCEDIELGWRLSRHGLRVVYEPDACAIMIRALSFDQFCDRSWRQGRSQYLFAKMHPDPEIRDYCEIDRALAAWRESWPDYARLLRRARRLEALTLAREEAGCPVHERLQEALDKAYSQAFFLSRAKGIADAMEADDKRPEPALPLALPEYARDIR